MTEPNITPLARRLAEENGIDWRTLKGSGPDGAIVERDILAFLAKVMAGEVELPPQPEDSEPPADIPDISQVQEALAREGVDLEELVPGITSETAPATGAAEDDVLFELDFAEEPAVEEPPETPFAAPETATDEVFFGTEPVAEAGEPFAAEDVAPEEAPVAPEEPWETEVEAPEGPEQALEELGEEFSWESISSASEAPLAESLAEEEPAMADDWSFTSEPEASAEATEETATGELFEEPTTQPAAPPERSLGEAVPLAEEPQEEPVEEAEPQPESEVELEPETEPEVAAEPAQQPAAPAQAVAYPPAFRRAVDLAALEKARVDLAEAWKKDVPPVLLLFRAVDRALAELEVPMRAVLGKLEGDGVTSLMVYPAGNLRALYDNIRAASEAAEGLVVIDLGETPYAEVLLPDTPLVTLGYSGMPAGMGLLSVSGELPTDRTRFLERVAFYLERPILLA